MQTIYLVRHATPDWGRADLPYHVPPGPPLTNKGKAEAQSLGEFLQQAGIQHIFASPLERCLSTAQIASFYTGSPVEVSTNLIEVQPGETETAIRTRLRPIFDLAASINDQAGPVALVTHGGPIMALLAELGMPAADISRHRIYDHRNPLPPAGAWSIKREEADQPWSFELVFVPEIKQALY